MREISTQEMDAVAGGSYRSIKRQADDDGTGVVRQSHWTHTDASVLDQSAPRTNTPVATDANQPRAGVFNWRFWKSFDARRSVNT